MTKERACANTPGLPRRGFLLAAPASAAAMAMPAAAGASSLTPVLAAFRQWQLMYETEVRQAPGMPEEAFDNMVLARCELETRLLEIPSRSPIDTIAKLAAWCDYGTAQMLDRHEAPLFWAEVSAQLARPV